MQLAISGALSTLTRTLAIVAPMHHYVWLTLGSSLYHLVTSSNSNNGQPEVSGDVTNAKDGLTLAAGSVVGTRNGGNSSTIRTMVDTGASGNYFDGTVITEVISSTIKSRLYGGKSQLQEEGISWRGSACCTGTSSTMTGCNT